MVGITLNPILLVHPRKNLAKESIDIALTRVDAELGDPDGLVEGLVELGQVVLEVVGVGPGVVVGDDKVDLAVAAAGHELLEVVDTLVGLVTVSDSRRADLKTLAGEGLDVLLVGGDGGVDVHAGSSTTLKHVSEDCGTCGTMDSPNLVRLVEAQDVLDIVLGASIGNVGRPAGGAPVLVG